MRHARGVSDRYNQISAKAQVAVLSMITIEPRAIVEETFKNCVDSGQKIRLNVSTTVSGDYMNTLLDNPASTIGAADVTPNCGKQGDAMSAPIVKTGLEESGDDVATTKNSVPLIDLLGTNAPAGMNQAVANLLRAAADVLEKAVVK